MSIASRLALLFAILSFVPLGLSGVLMYLRFTESQQLNEMRSLRTLASHKQARFEGWIDENFRLVREIASRPSLRAYARGVTDPETNRERFIDLIRREHLGATLPDNPDIRELFLLDAATGRKLVSSEPGRENRFHANETYFQKGLVQPWIQAPYYPLSMDDPSITVSTPIKTEGGDAVAVLAGHLDLTAITEIVQQGFGESRTLDSYLVNRFSAFVTRARFADDATLRRVVHTQGIDRCLGGESGEGTYIDYRGVPVIGAFLWLPRWELCLLVERDVEEAMLPVQRFRDYMIILLAGMAVVVAGLIGFVSRQISRPIIEVVDAAEKIGRGALDTRLPVQSRDELHVRLPARHDGEMARLFDGVNRMAASLGSVTASRDELDREVDARRRVVRSLQESERRLNILMSNLPGMAYRCENNTDWTMRFVSEGCQEVTGLEPAALLNNRSVSYAELVHPADRERLWTRVQEAVVAGRPFELEYRIRHADGNWRWVWEKGRSVSAPGASPEILEGFIHDITERQRLTKELQQAQKMEILGQVTGGVAHDFNNLLGVILGYTALARKHCGNDPVATRYLEHVGHAGERARDIVAQMLAFSRGDAGADEVIDIRDRVEEELDMLRSTLPASVSLSVDLDEDVPGVELQPGQLNQVLMNLCINARDAMNGTGTLSIQLRTRRGFSAECSVSHRSFSGDFVELGIGDTGPGIEPDRVEKIFDPFYTTKSAGKGSGLGLAVVDGIVRGHGGFIVVDRRSGGGAEFRVYFPIARTDAEKPRKEVLRLPAADGAGRRLLIVDDEVGLAEFLGEYLASCGYDTTVHAAAEHALTEFRQAPQAYDLVITDQTMPGMSGLELVEALRTLRPTLPIILCTGFSEFIDAEGARERNVGFLAKPVDPERLLDLVAAYLSGVEPSPP